MKEHHIRVRPDRLNAPLVPCNVGKLSSAVFVVEGDIPDDMDTLSVRIGRVPDPSTEPPTPREDFTAAASRQDDGTFRCYLAPFYFPDVSAELAYHIVGADLEGNSRWLGTGGLIVEDCPANGSPIIPPIIPADTYIRNPATGKYHKLTAELNELGEITIDVDKEGIDR